jgi:hypothetical protein
LERSACLNVDAGCRRSALNLVQFRPASERLSLRFGN